MAQVAFEELLAINDRWQVELANSERVVTPNVRGFAPLPLTLTLR